MGTRISKSLLNFDEIERYMLLLKNHPTEIAKAMLFYLINENEKFLPKKEFVLKILRKYATIDEEYSTHDFEYIYTLHLNGLPTKIKNKLIIKYHEDFIQNEQAKESKETEDEKLLIDEMNEIF